MGNYRAETENTAPATIPNDIEQGNQYFLENHSLDALSEDERANKQKRRTRRNLKMKICAGISLVTVIIGFVTACLFRNPTVLAYPLHASCNITWTLSTSCNDAANALVQQIETWKTNETCGTGQKCLYSLDSVNGNVLKLTHTTPVRHYIDDMTYTFYPSATKGCNVVGFSTSRVWYAILDYGTNYCNLHNLVEGAGLMKDSLYSELTRDEICTQYTSANCDKY